MSRDDGDPVAQVLLLLIGDLVAACIGTPVEETVRFISRGLRVLVIEQAHTVRELRAGLPVVPANPAGTTALGDLPDLRTFVVDVAEGGITCGDPDCPALGDMEVSFRRLPVSDLLQRIARHRRSCHTPGVVNSCSGGTA